MISLPRNITWIEWPKERSERKGSPIGYNQSSCEHVSGRSPSWALVLGIVGGWERRREVMSFECWGIIEVDEKEAKSQLTIDIRNDLFDY